jgi:RHS repeat-associated protein
MPIDKNGYLYIYVSNTTPNINVFFDNLQVTHVRGQILEETHYYPFGLVMAGISNKAAGTMLNKEKTFQGQRFDDDFDLNCVQFKWRNHDPQIGRFIEIDPLSEEYNYNSTYAFSENKVTNHIELEGLESISAGPPQGYFYEGFRQLFQAASRLMPSFKGEVHFNKGVEVKTEAKTTAGTVENKTTTTVFQSKVELETNFTDYFKNKGGSMINFSFGTQTLSQVETTTSATVNTPGAPLKMSTKTTKDENGVSQTTSVGTGASVKIGNRGDVSVSAVGFVKEQLTGNNAGQTTFGFKASVDATFVSKSVVLINTPVIKVTQKTQTVIGGSFTLQNKFPFPW